MAKKLDPALSIQNIPYPTTNDFKNLELRNNSKMLANGKNQDGIEKSSPKNAYHSQERADQKSMVEDEDSDDDNMDLAVLQNQAKLLSQHN